MKCAFRTYTEKDQEIVSQYMHGLYIDDPSPISMTEEKIRRTFQALQKTPEYGTIMVFECDSIVVGYAILINYWSHEYGGNLLNLDELYVAPTFRRQGIATTFITYLLETRPMNAVGLQLEVSPTNKRARSLYTSLGFTTHKNETLTKQF
jgi:ribosomal protein S18 acetylase RimI-like enzyme